MIDVAVAYNKYKFAGYEFLTWIWFLTETDNKYIEETAGDIKEFYIGDKIVIENFKEDSSEKITISGDKANLDEGALALKKGALVTEMKIILKTMDDKDIKFNIKGESLDISGFNILKHKFSSSPEEIEGSVIEKVYFMELLTGIVDKLFQKFILLRISDKWTNTELSKISRWIDERNKSF